MPSQFERVQIETTTKNEIIDSETALAVHRADSAPNRRRRRGRGRGRRRSRDRKRRDREREQAAMPEGA